MGLRTDSFGLESQCHPLRRGALIARGSLLRRCQVTGDCILLDFVDHDLVGLPAAGEDKLYRLIDGPIFFLNGLVVDD